MNNEPLFFKTLLLKGEAGGTIDRIVKTDTVGLTDIYTIYINDGSTQEIEVTNGSSIDSIEYTSSSGNVDTYTVTLTDGSTTTFNVTNGEDYTVPTDGVIFYDGTDTPDGYEDVNPPAGQGCEIDDANVSLSTTYSSSKIEQLISGVGGGGVDYSTTEQDTGLKWLDGRTIYQKTYVFNDGNFGMDFTFTDSALINCSIIRGWNYFQNNDNGYSYTDTAIQYISWFNTGQVKLAWGPQVAFYMSNTNIGYVTLQYIKLSETPNS